MRALLLWLIEFYQINLSPYKGFRCSYRVVTGRRSCSAFAVAAIERCGVVVGLLLSRRRFRKCAEAANARNVRARVPAGQEGHCDLPVADCALGHGGHHCDSDICDCFPSDDCGCGERMSRKMRERRLARQRHS